MNSLLNKLATVGAAAAMTIAGVAFATPSGAAESPSSPTTLAQSTPSSGASSATSTPSSTTSQSTAAPSSSTPSPSPSTSTTGGTSNDTSGSTAAPAAGTPSQEVEARKIFDQLDTNHDGTLSFDEFSRATFRAK